MKFENVGTAYDLTPGTQYAIYLMTNTAGVRWIKSGGDTYAGGTRRQMENVWSGDFPFYTMGYTIVEDPPAEDPPAEDPPAEDPPAEDQEENTGETGTDNPPVETNEKDTITLTQSSDEAEKEEAEDIETPTIVKVEKNDVEVTEYLDGVTVKQNDTFVVSGSSVGVDKVVLIIGNKAFSVTPEEDGSWVMSIDLEQLEIGEYTIKIQGQKEEEGSSIEEIFGLEITPSAGVSDENGEGYIPTFYYKLISGKYRLFTIALLSLLYLVLMTVFFFFPLKKRKIEEKEKSNKKAS